MLGCESDGRDSRMVLLNAVRGRGYFAFVLRYPPTTPVNNPPEARQHHGGTLPFWPSWKARRALTVILSCLKMQIRSPKSQAEPFLPPGQATISALSLSERLKARYLCLRSIRFPHATHVCRSSGARFRFQLSQLKAGRPIEKVEVKITYGTSCGSRKHQTHPQI